MNVTRRDVVVAGALALGASDLLLSVVGNSAIARQGFRLPTPA